MKDNNDSTKKLDPNNGIWANPEINAPVDRQIGIFYKKTQK